MKCVIVVDASKIAEKAIEIVKANGLDKFITYAVFNLFIPICSNPKVWLCSVLSMEGSNI